MRARAIQPAGTAGFNERAMRRARLVDQRPSDADATAQSGGPIRRMAGRTAAAVTNARHLHWAAVLFIISLPVPWIIAIGPVRMSVYRFVLLATLVPSLIGWLRGKAGPIRLADLLLVCYCLWCFIAIIAIHGFAFAIQPAGIIFMETMGAYLLARCCIRSADDFEAMVRLLFKVVLVLLPFAILESVSGQNSLMEVLSKILPTPPPVDMEPRWGLRRVQSVFEHPILFGVGCGCILAMTHIVLGYQKSFLRRWTPTGLVGLAAFLSLSAGPITALAAQIMLMGWNWVMRSIAARWKILIFFVALAAVSAELLSNRSVPVIFISYFSFDESSAWLRVAIWRFGSESVMNNPLFGVGFNEWERPDWMSFSIDMFWIVDAVRHGFLAGFFMMSGFFAMFITLAMKKGLDDRASAYRMAFLISMTGFFMVGWTVYFWNSAYVLFLFLLGSGGWILDVKDSVPAALKTRKAMRAGDSVEADLSGGRRAYR